jgi:hypothetical protein
MAQIYTQTNSTLQYTNSIVWGGWNATYVSTTSTTNNYYNIQGGQVWQLWNAILETDQERAQRALNDADMRRRYEEQRRLQEVENAERARLDELAQAAANELLTALLSDEQQSTWSEHGFFTVRGSASGRAYRIRRGCINNVDRLTEDETHRERIFCAHPPGLPDADCNLAQMLLLVTDEPAFLRVANGHSPGAFEAELPGLPARPRPRPLLEVVADPEEGIAVAA